jgi:hypothetical protein
MTKAVIDTDHLFNDHRIALEIAVLRLVRDIAGRAATEVSQSS